MRRFLIGFATVAVLGVGATIIAVAYLPLEVIMASPLGYFTRIEVAPSHRMRTRVTNADDFWREVDAFASARGLRFFGGPVASERLRDEYVGSDSYRFGASLVGDIGSVAFFSTGPKHAPLAPIVAAFKQSMTGFTFKDYSVPDENARLEPSLSDSAPTVGTETFDTFPIDKLLGRFVISPIAGTNP